MIEFLKVVSIWAAILFPAIVLSTLNVLKPLIKLSSVESMVEKKIKGHKRHIVTDTQGHLLYIKVHAANIHDTVAGCEVFEEAVKKHSSLQGLCADAGYRKTMENFVRERLKKKIQISQRIQPG